MNCRSLLIMVAGVASAGCVGSQPEGYAVPDSVSYVVQQAGPLTSQSLVVDLDRGWNRVGGQPYMPTGGKVFSQDGILLDRLLLIPGIPPGDVVFKLAGDVQQRAVRANLRVDEVAELVEDSVHKLLGEGQATLAVTRVEPASFAGNAGVRLEFAGAVQGGTDYLGRAGAFMHDNKLYAVIHLAALPYYADRHRDRAWAVIASARPR